MRLVFTTAGAALACAVMTFPRRRARHPAVLRGRRPGAGAGGAQRWAPGGSTAFVTVTLPLAAPGILVGGVIAFATCLGEFGAVITFAANIPGADADSAAGDLHRPAGARRRGAARPPLSLVSLLLALGGLALSEWLARRLAQAVGR